MFIKASGLKLVQPLRWAYAVSRNEHPVLPRNRRRGSEKTRGTRQSVWSDNSRTDVVGFTKSVCIKNAYRPRHTSSLFSQTIMSTFRHELDFDCTRPRDRCVKGKYQLSAFSSAANRHFTRLFL